MAAIRMLFDWLVVGQVLPTNPLSSVHWLNPMLKLGKALVLNADQTRRLLDSIDMSHVAGLRDRVLIVVLVFSFARVGAVVGKKVGGYYSNGKS